jgi:hypothetical protein
MNGKGRSVPTAATGLLARQYNRYLANVIQLAKTAMTEMVSGTEIFSDGAWREVYWAWAEGSGQVLVSLKATGICPAGETCIRKPATAQRFALRTPPRPPIDRAEKRCEIGMLDSLNRSALAGSSNCAKRGGRTALV